MRSEFSAIEAAFDKLAALTGNGGKLLRVNAGGTAQEALNLNAGQILYGGASNGVAQSNNFNWNTTNNTLAITGNVSASNLVQAPNANFSTGVRTPLVIDGAAGIGELLGSTSTAIQHGLGNQWTAHAFYTLGIERGRFNNNGLQTSNIDSGSGSLVLKGAGSTAATITNANVSFAGTLSAIGSALLNNTNVAGTLSVVGNATLNNMNLAGVLTGTPSMLSPVNNSLAADVVLNNTSLYFDGPSVAQGNNGTWFASGTVTIRDGDANTVRPFMAKLWDGNTVIDSAYTESYSTSLPRATISLSGFITTPTGNIRISVRPVSGTNANIMFNSSGLGKDSTITAVRIG
jgi:hypothetical protein